MQKINHSSFSKNFFSSFFGNWLKKWITDAVAQVFANVYKTKSFKSLDKYPEYYTILAYFGSLSSLEKTAFVKDCKEFFVDTSLLGDHLVSIKEKTNISDDALLVYLLQGIHDMLCDNTRRANSSILDTCFLHAKGHSSKWKFNEDGRFDWGFTYVPTDSSVFMEIFIDIVTSVDFRNSSFIDIGCGVPILSDFMKQTGCKDSSGLEYNTKLINEVKDDYPNLKLYTEDMLKYQEYGKYDILYSYNPLCNSKKMDDALFLIIEQMKIGAVFYFSPAAVSLDFKEWGFEAPSNIHWFKFTKIVPFEQTMQERIGRLSPFLDVIKYYVDDGDKGDIKNRDKKEITVFLSLLSYLDCSLQKKKELLLEIEKYLPIVYKDEDGFRLWVLSDYLCEFLGPLPWNFRDYSEDQLWSKLALFLIKDLLEKSIELSEKEEQPE